MNQTNETPGFTLIEMAIVIVIIGLLLAIVMKGQDILINAKAKKAVKWIREWESAPMSFYFRYDRLPGDTDGNGIIADEPSPTSPLQEIIDEDIIKESKKSINLMGGVFYIKMGYDTISGNKRNAIVVCPSNTCSRALLDDEASSMEVIDNMLDDSADAGKGSVRGFTGVTLAAGGDAVTNVVEEGTSGDWSTSYKGLVYYFEKSD